MCSTTQPRGWEEVNSGRLKEGSQALWLCFSVWNTNCQTTMAQHLCFVPARVTGLSCKLTLPTPAGMLTVLLQSASHNFILPCLVVASQRTAGCRVVSVASLSSFPFSFPQFAPTCPPLDVSMCVSLRHVCALSGNTMSNYSCLNCRNLKGIGQVDLSHCHFSGVLNSLSLQRSIHHHGLKTS